jgi:hypothetical protein
MGHQDSYRMHTTCVYGMDYVSFDGMAAYFTYTQSNGKCFMHFASRNGDFHILVCVRGRRDASKLEVSGGDFHFTRVSWRLQPTTELTNIINILIIITNNDVDIWLRN